MSKIKFHRYSAALHHNLWFAHEHLCTKISHVSTSVGFSHSTPPFNKSKIVALVQKLLKNDLMGLGKVLWIPSNRIFTVPTEMQSLVFFKAITLPSHRFNFIKVALSIYSHQLVCFSPCSFLPVQDNTVALTNKKNPTFIKQGNDSYREKVVSH